MTNSALSNIGMNHNAESKQNLFSW